MESHFPYRAIIAWNSLPSHIAHMNSKPGFKKQIKQHLTALLTELLSTI
jgi:hypothetical protein